MDGKPDDMQDHKDMESFKSDAPIAGADSPEGIEQEVPKTTVAPVEIKLLSFDYGSKSKGSGGTFSRGCLSIGCGLGIVVLIGIFGAGYSSLKQSVWVGFDASCERVATSLPFEMTAGRRERLNKDMKAFAEVLQTMDDPYETMGKFTSEVNLSFRDGMLSMSEVERIESILDEILRPKALLD